MGIDVGISIQRYQENGNSQLTTSGSHVGSRTPMKVTMDIQVGQIVSYHYTSLDGDYRPAVITKVWTRERVNLIIFNDGTDDLDRPIVEQATLVKQGKLANQWDFCSTDDCNDGAPDAVTPRALGAVIGTYALQCVPVHPRGVERIWLVKCAVCSWKLEQATYEEANIHFTGHFNAAHPTWVTDHFKS